MADINNNGLYQRRVQLSKPSEGIQMRLLIAIFTQVTLLSVACSFSAANQAITFDQVQQGNRIVITVRNNANETVEAFMYCVNFAKEGKKKLTNCRYYDVAVNRGHDTEIRPSEIRSFPFFRLDGVEGYEWSGTERFAYLTLGGREVGDPVLLATLRGRRALIAAEIASVREVIQYSALIDDTSEQLLTRLAASQPSVDRAAYRTEVETNIALLSGFVFTGVIKTITATRANYPDRPFKGQRTAILHRLASWDKALCPPGESCAGR